MLMKTQVLIISYHDVDDNKRESVRARTKMAPGPSGNQRQIGHHQGTKTQRKDANLLASAPRRLSGDKHFHDFLTASRSHSQTPWFCPDDFTCEMVARICPDSWRRYDIVPCFGAPNRTTADGVPHFSTANQFRILALFARVPGFGQKKGAGIGPTPGSIIKPKLRTTGATSCR
jgi:hypothetical protein